MTDAAGRAQTKRAAGAPKARRAGRRHRATRDLRIVNLLASGVSMAEIALREGVSPRRMRELVAEILARREVDPPVGFVALQVRRLSEALMVAYGAMGEGNLDAVDRVVKIVRELDRYHGFAPAPPSAPPPAPARLPPPPALPALAPPRADGAAENRPPSD